VGPKMKVSEITEAAYPSNVGIMELVQFYKLASESEKNILDQLMSTGKITAAWRLIQQVTGVNLQGKEFDHVMEKLKKVSGKWALVSKKDPDKVLQYYRGPGDKKPSPEWEKKVERRVHAFEDIPRNQMPQIDLRHIKGNYNFKQGLVDISEITPVQSERTIKDTADARKLVASGKSKPIILDRDGHIVNGHHRYDAYLEQGYDRIPAIRVDATLPELMQVFVHTVEENFADGKVSGKSRPGRVKKAGASCKGSVSQLKKLAAKHGGEKGKMYQWCLNMKRGRENK
jgi:hypothetical protein